MTIDIEYFRHRRTQAADILAILISRPGSTENEIYMARLDLDYWRKSVQNAKKQIASQQPEGN